MSALMNTSDDSKIPTALSIGENDQRMLKLVALPSFKKQKRASKKKKLKRIRKIKRESILFIWLDLQSESTPAFMHSLRAINDRVQVYSNESACLNALKILQGRIFFISSSSNQELIAKLNAFENIEAIFVPDSDVTFIKGEYSKLLGFFPDLLGLLPILKAKVERYQKIILEKFLFEQDDLFRWLQSWKEEWTTQPTSTDCKTRFLEVARTYYRNNFSRMNLINEFENRYSPKDALQWCILSPFPSALIRHAFLTCQAEQLDLYRFLIDDASRMIRVRSKRFRSVQLYRGMKLTKQLIDTFMMNIGKIVCASGFFTSMKSRAIALDMALSPEYRPDFSPVLFKIHCNSLANFAEVFDNKCTSSFVFDVASRFRIIFINRGKLTVVKMRTVCGDSDGVLFENKSDRRRPTIQALYDELLAASKPLLAPSLKPLSAALSRQHTAQLTKQPPSASSKLNVVTSSELQPVNTDHSSTYLVKTSSATSVSKRVLSPPMEQSMPKHSASLRPRSSSTVSSLGKSIVSASSTDLLRPSSAPLESKLPKPHPSHVPKDIFHPLKHPKLQDTLKKLPTHVSKLNQSHASQALLPKVSRLRLPTNKKPNRLHSPHMSPSSPSTPSFPHPEQLPLASLKPLSPVPYSLRQPPSTLKHKLLPALESQAQPNTQSRALPAISAQVLPIRKPHPSKKPGIHPGSQLKLDADISSQTLQVSELPSLTQSEEKMDSNSQLTITKPHETLAFQDQPSNETKTALSLTPSAANVETSTMLTDSETKQIPIPGQNMASTLNAQVSVPLKAEENVTSSTQVPVKKISHMLHTNKVKPLSKPNTKPSHATGAEPVRVLEASASFQSEIPQSSHEGNLPTSTLTSQSVGTINEASTSDPIPKTVVAFKKKHTSSLKQKSNKSLSLRMSSGLKSKHPNTSMTKIKPKPETQENLILNSAVPTTLNDSVDSVTVLQTSHTSQPKPALTGNIPDSRLDLPSLPDAGTERVGDLTQQQAFSSDPETCHQIYVNEPLTVNVQPEQALGPQLIHLKTEEPTSLSKSNVSSTSKIKPTTHSKTTVPQTQTSGSKQALEAEAKQPSTIDKKIPLGLQKQHAPGPKPTSRSIVTLHVLPAIEREGFSHKKDNLILDSGQLPISEATLKSTTGSKARSTHISDQQTTSIELQQNTVPNVPAASTFESQPPSTIINEPASESKSEKLFGTQEPACTMPDSRVESDIAVVHPATMNHEVAISIEPQPSIDVTPNLSTNEYATTSTSKTSKSVGPKKPYKVSRNKGTSLSTFKPLSSTVSTPTPATDLQTSRSLDTMLDVASTIKLESHMGTKPQNASGLRKGPLRAIEPLSTSAFTPNSATDLETPSQLLGDSDRQMPISAVVEQRITEIESEEHLRSDEQLISDSEQQQQQQVRFLTGKLPPQRKKQKPVGSKNKTTPTSKSRLSPMLDSQASVDAREKQPALSKPQVASTSKTKALEARKQSLVSNLNSVSNFGNSEQLPTVIEQPETPDENEVIPLPFESQSSRPVSTIDATTVLKPDSTRISEDQLKSSTVKQPIHSNELPTHAMTKGGTVQKTIKKSAGSKKKQNAAPKKPHTPVLNSYVPVDSTGKQPVISQSQLSSDLEIQTSQSLQGELTFTSDTPLSSTAALETTNMSKQDSIDKGETQVIHTDLETPSVPISNTPSIQQSRSVHFSDEQYPDSSGTEMEATTHLNAAPTTNTQEELSNFKKTKKPNGSKKKNAPVLKQRLNPVSISQITSDSEVKHLPKSNVPINTSSESQMFAPIDSETVQLSGDESEVITKSNTNVLNAAVPEIRSDVLMKEKSDRSQKRRVQPNKTARKAPVSKTQTKPISRLEGPSSPKTISDTASRYENTEPYVNTTGNKIHNVADIILQAENYIKNNEIDLAIAKYQSVKSGSAPVLFQLGCLYSNRKMDYPNALSCFMEALELQESANESPADTLTQLGLLHNDCGEFALGLEYHTRALNLYESSDLSAQASIATNLVGIANARRGTGEISEALDYAQRALAIHQSLEPVDELCVATDTAVLANIHYDLGETSEALELAKNAHATYQTLLPPDSPAIASILNNLAVIEFSLGELTKAQQYLEQSLEIFRQSYPPGHPRIAKLETNLQRAIQIQQREENGSDDEL